MRTFKCQDCGTIWTNKQTRTKVDPSKVRTQRCIDCSTFDWPKYNKRKVEVEQSLGKK